MAVNINPAKVDLGMYLNVAVNDKANKTMRPVNIPPNGVFTFDALFTAVLVNEPAVGIDLTKEPAMLQAPNAIISCVASKVLPLAVNKRLLLIFSMFLGKKKNTKDFKYSKFTKSFCNGYGF